VLGYEQLGQEDLVDPLGRGPGFWFQEMDAPREQRNRIHVDVLVPHDQAEARVAAAIAAGGRLVSEAWRACPRRRRAVNRVRTNCPARCSGRRRRLKRPSPRRATAVETYGDEERAHRVAYAALERKFEKAGDHWEKKDAANHAKK
jgi:hypothetical protein